MDAAAIGLVVEVDNTHKPHISIDIDWLLRYDYDLPLSTSRFLVLLRALVLALAGGSFVLVCNGDGGRILDEATADWTIQCHQRHLLIMLGTESDPPITAGSARVVSAVLLALLDWLWSRSGWRCRRCCYCCSSAMGRVNSLLCVTHRVSFYAWIGGVAKLQILRFFCNDLCNPGCKFSQRCHQKCWNITV